MATLLLRRQTHFFLARGSRCLSAASHDMVLSHPSTVDEGGGSERGRIVCITSGKGGVGKTTSAASFAFGLASVSNTKSRFYIIFC